MPPTAVSLGLAGCNEDWQALMFTVVAVVAGGWSMYLIADAARQLAAESARHRGVVKGLRPAPR